MGCQGDGRSARRSTSPVDDAKYPPATVAAGRTPLCVLAARAAIGALGFGAVNAFANTMSVTRSSRPSGEMPSELQRTTDVSWRAERVSRAALEVRGAACLDRG